MMAGGFTCVATMKTAVLFLTLTVLLTTRPTEAVDCSGSSVCMNSGTCPAGGQTPCNCSASAYVGDTCEDEVCTTDDECLNDGRCGVEDSAKVCFCGDYFGKTCADACETNEHCGPEGTCNAGSPNTCTCPAGYGGDRCASEPECQNDTVCEKAKLEVCRKDVQPYKCDCDNGYSRSDDDEKCTSEVGGVDNGSVLVQVSLMSLMMSLIVSAL